jgi:uncharacterized protein YsxB (DUF464 family)
MVNVKIGLMELEVKGHAESPRVNDCDLVCCAVSILTETLSRYMEHYMEGGYLAALDQQIKPGDSYIRAKPYGWSAGHTVTAFETIRYGLRALAEEYPEYIKLEEV